MATAITRLIKNLPKESLETFFSGVHSEIADSIDWDADQRTVRKSLLEAASIAVGVPLAKLRSDAERIDALTDELGQSILKHSLQDNELSDYYELVNEHDRALWLFLTDQERFRLVEDLWYVDTNRQSRMWDGFLGPQDCLLDTSEKQLSTFKEKLLALFRAAGKIKVDVYDRTHVDGEDEEITVTQIMVYREGLPSTQLAFKDNNLVRRVFRPVKEVALTYEPISGHIEVVAEGKEQRKEIAKIFSEALLEKPINGQGIPLRRYDIQKLLKSKALSTDSEDGIEFAKVTQLKVAPLNSNNNVTLDIPTNEERSIYQVASAYFGDNNPLKSGFRLTKARISIKFMPDQESRRGKVLHVVLREPNGCNLKSKTQKEKLIGEKYLERWELVEPMQ